MLKYPYVSLFFIWSVVVLAIWPLGNFPLNDDWAYAKSVKWLVNDGRLDTVDWPSMNLIGQTFIGAFWCKIFGFGFLQLRILTLLLSFIILIYTHKIIFKLSNNALAALVSSLVILSNPFFQNLSFSFMTEIYFLTPLVIAMYYFMCFLKDKTNKSYLYLFTLFVCIALTVRQTGLLLFVAGFIAGIFYLKKQYKNQMILVGIFLLFIVFYFTLQYFIRITFNSNPSYMGTGSIYSELVQHNLFAQMFYRMGIILLTCGLFLLPITLNVGINNWRNFSKKQHLIVGGIMLPFIVPMIRQFTFFPSGNVFYFFGLGPLTLKDQLMITNNSTSLSISHIVLSLLALVGGLLLLHSVFLAIYKAFQSKDYKSQTILMLALFVLCLCGSFFIPAFFFDRYTITLIVPLMAILLADKNQFKLNALSVAMLVVILFFSVSSMRTYFNWNKVRWNELDILTNEKQISPFEIDGGFEFNGWYQTGKVNQTQGKSWWFVKDDLYAISFKSLKEYKIVKKRIYYNCLLFKADTLYVLQRN